MNLYYLLIAIGLVNAASTPRGNNGHSTPSGGQLNRNSNSSPRSLATGRNTRPSTSPTRSPANGNGAAWYPGRTNSGVHSPIHGHGNVQSRGRSPALANDSVQYDGAQSPNQRSPVSFQGYFTPRDVPQFPGSNGNHRAVVEMVNGRRTIGHYRGFSPIRGISLLEVPERLALNDGAQFPNQRNPGSNENHRAVVPGRLPFMPFPDISRGPERR
jgi:hypothetical protein